MAVKIRLQRTGATNAPCYRIGVFDGRTRRQGRSIEILGHYDPRNKVESKQLTLDTERVLHWLKVGAQPSATVTSFIKKLGVTYDSGSTREARKRAKSKANRKVRGAKKAAAK